MDTLKTNVIDIIKLLNKSVLDFEKDIINELMKIFNVKQKQIDQIKKELKSTNPHKINKRKGKQKKDNNETNRQPT